MSDNWGAKRIEVIEQALEAAARRGVDNSRRPFTIGKLRHDARALLTALARIDVEELDALTDRVRAQMGFDS